jgi:hypothetical protein
MTRRPRRWLTATLLGAASVGAANALRGARGPKLDGDVLAMLSLSTSMPRGIDPSLDNDVMTTGFLRCQRLRDWSPRTRTRAIRRRHGSS